MNQWVGALGALCVVAASSAWSAPPPAAIFTDPPADNAFPARSEVLHIGSGGVLINGLAYIPAGQGPHPVVVLLHGLPGNEKNLDLAQAMRRAGWVVVTFNYRGSWGSPGPFTMHGNLEDAASILANIRTPELAAKLQIDPRHVVLMGHSMGGWVTAVVGAHDPDLEGVALISAADMSALRLAPAAARLRTAQENMETLAVPSAQALADQFLAIPQSESFAASAAGLATRPLLALTADDGLAPDAEALVRQIRAAGGQKATLVHVATDHSWNTARIRLESEVLTWLASLPGAPGR